MNGPRRSFCHNADGSPKWAYFDKREAKSIARAVRQLPAYQSASGDIHIYRCPACSSYHIGHDNTGGAAA